MVLVGEGVFRIELELIDFPRSKEIDNLVEGLHGGHLIAADVEHEASAQQVGRVGDAEFREVLFLGEGVFQKLTEGLHAVEKPLFCPADDADRLVFDSQFVILRRKTRIDTQSYFDDILAIFVESDILFPRGEVELREVVLHLLELVMVVCNAFIFLNINLSRSRNKIIFQISCRSGSDGQHRQ